jgi:hypothetical protein
MEGLCEFIELLRILSLEKCIGSALLYLVPYES